MNLLFPKKDMLERLARELLGLNWAHVYTVNAIGFNAIPAYSTWSDAVPGWVLMSDDCGPAIDHADTHHRDGSLLSLRLRLPHFGYHEPVEAGINSFFVAQLYNGSTIDRAREEVESRLNARARYVDYESGTALFKNPWSPLLVAQAATMSADGEFIAQVSDESRVTFVLHAQCADLRHGQELLTRVRSISGVSGALGLVVR